MANSSEVESAELRFEKQFSSDYELHPLLCPNGDRLRDEVAQLLAAHGCKNVVELGPGTGLLTERLLAIPSCTVESIDNDKNFLSICAKRLESACAQGSLTLTEGDCLSILKNRKGASVDAIAQVYVMHNFNREYRAACFKEIQRVLRPGALLVMGDRVGYSDIKLHEAAIADEISCYFDVLVPRGKFDLLKTWILHVYGDEHPSRQFCDQELYALLRDNSFGQIKQYFRQGLNIVVSARKMG